MKGDHRKELQTNILADRMGRFMQEMRTSPQSRSAGIITLLGLALFTYIAWQVAMARSGNTELWTRLDQDSLAQQSQVTGDVTRQIAIELRGVSDEAPATVVGRTARFQRARLLLSAGLTRLYSQEHEAVKEVEQARAIYRDLVDQCRDEPLLAQEALMGSAQAEEALVGVPDIEDGEKSVGSLDQAIATYRTLTSRYPASYLGQQASARLKNIEENRKNVEQFYASMRKAADKAATSPFNVPAGLPAGHP